jgi:glycolate oxidase FAD binding subunit
MNAMTKDNRRLFIHDIASLQEAVVSQPLISICSGGSKPALSASNHDGAVLDLSELTGILEYEPNEYTFTARSGTTLAEVRSALREHGQYLPFDPPFVEAGATLGGTVAAGLSGSGRYRFGGVRDFLIGVRFVDGCGRLVRGGGKVVKNAAGFDLPKLMVGSLGRYGAIVECTFKVFPRPRAYSTLVTHFPTLEAALAGVGKLATASLDVDALDILTLPDDDEGPQLLVRMGGSDETLPPRMERLRQLLGAGDIVPSEVDKTLWANATEFRWAPSDSLLAKVPITPARIPALDAGLSAIGAARRYAVGGNLAWLAHNGAVPAIDNLLSEQRLSAVIIRGGDAISRLGPLEPAPFADRIRQALDPDHRFLQL